MSKVVWTNEKRKVKDLIPWPRNPRRITEIRMSQLKESLNKFGYADPVIVNVDNQLIAGHMRLKAMAILKMVTPDTLVDVRVPSRRLTEDEAKELAVRHNGKFGEWNMEMLTGDFTMGELLNFGFSNFELGLDMGDLTPSAPIGKAPESADQGENPLDSMPQGDPQGATEPNPPGNPSPAPEGAPDAAGAPQAPGDSLTLNDVSEMNPKLQAFLDRRKAAKERGKDKGQLNFWLGIVFQSYEQKLEFIQALGLETKYEMYADGQALAAKVSIPLKVSDQKPIQVPLDKTLTQMVQQ